jgi:HD-GYP domain-containing protein (c-di-GMP phosphodiesterase class II)
LKTYEFELIKSNAQSGYDILKDIDFPWPIAAIAHQHHERLDGKGYPQGLIGNQICLEARIVAVADVVEAMASDRPYRPGLGLDKAIAEISKNKGVSFDALAVEACIAVVSADGFDFDAPLD